MATDATAAPSAAAPPAPAPSAPPPAVRDECRYKNRLQELALQIVEKFPIYHTECEGEQHQLKFRSTVHVGSERFLSSRCHSRLKDAEQDAAKVAYDILSRKDDDVHGLIDQDVLFSKSILHEFSVKTKATMPSYTTDQVKGLGPMTLFVSSVLFAGSTYTGEAAKSKKEADQKAARAAVKSILATNNSCMLQIIRSKKRLITAVTSSGFNKEKGDVNQENHNAPTNASPPIAPIKFVHAVESSYPTTDQGVNIIPAADPSAQAVPGSKKRKKKKTGPHATEDSVDEQHSACRNMRLT